MGAIMRIKVLAFAASLVLISNSSLGSPQTPTTPTSSLQAATLLAQSAKALIGSAAVNDVTLTGTVEWIAGSDDETGTVTYKGLSGAYRLDMTFRNGTKSEIRINDANGLTGTWVGTDGVSHGIAPHNLMTDQGWFPFFVLSSIGSFANRQIAYVGQETHNGALVHHISTSQVTILHGDPNPELTQHLTQVDIYLDSATLLPTSYVFNSHPDDNALYDLPTEIRYSNYQTISGIPVPLHVQKLVNNCLFLDVQFQSATFNSGITATQISSK
jgi:hypothetical protein